MPTDDDLAEKTAVFKPFFELHSLAELRIIAEILSKPLDRYTSFSDLSKLVKCKSQVQNLK